MIEEYLHDPTGKNGQMAAFNRALGNILRQAREEAVLTQLQAAYAVGCTPSEISLYERGLRAVPFFRVARLCDAYGIAVGEVAKALC